MTTLDELKLGALLLPNQASALPLQGTEVTAAITGALVRVQVTQRFGNPFTHPVELEYLFPLPHEAAVIDYSVTIGSRTIRAAVQELQAARAAYQQAISAGQRASLLEQRRPNLFSLQFGNVQASEAVVTTLTFEDRLRFNDGAYEFVFPMGITPRYHTAADADTPTASGVTAPIELDETKIAPVTLTVSIDAGAPLADPTSRTHPLTLTRQDDQRVNLALAGRHIPNKDFVLTYRLSTEALTPTLWSSAEDGSETALLLLVPPRLDLKAEPAPREFIFVVDRSGSMSTHPMEQAKNALRACLRALGSADTFLIQAFDDRIEWFDAQPRPMTQASVDAVDRWLEHLHARGGTEILGAIQAALAVPTDPARQRYIVFLTDGAVSADDAAIQQIARQRQGARVFTFGIGASVNRYLLSKMAQLGQGVAEFIGAQDDLEAALTRLQDRLSYPALLHVALTWEDAQAWDTYPATLPDVYSGQPLELITKVQRTGANPRVIVKGQRGGVPVELVTPLPPVGAPNPLLGRLHARARIETLHDDAARGSSAEDARQAIIALALKHRLLTRYTAFIAIDSEVTPQAEAAAKIVVALPLPEGLDAAGFGLSSGTQTLTGAQFAMLASAPAAPPDIVHHIRAPKMLASKRAAKERLADLPEIEYERGITLPEPAPADEPSDDLLKELARTQQINGSWADDIELTAAALLLFIRSGHTTRAGSYRRHIAKAVQWLHAVIGMAIGFEFYATIRALDELYHASGDGQMPDATTLRLPPCTTDAERAARGDTDVTPPTQYDTLDAARTGGILRITSGQTYGGSPDAAQAQRVRLWLAVGRA